MICRLFLVLPLAAALPLFAQPAWSIAPTSGPTSGGTELMMKGDFGLSNYSVIFDAAAYGFVSVPAQKIDEHTLRAMTPPHFPGRVLIGVDDDDTSTPLFSFEYVGNPPDQYERLLLPTLTKEVRGAFGSLFRTDLLIANHGTTDLRLFGIVEDCFPEWCYPTSLDEPFEVPPGQEIPPELIGYGGTPGRFVYVAKPQLQSLSLNLRVHDTTRAELNFGTEIPIVRENRFALNRIVLVGVPADPHFRNTLRIYGTFPFTAVVKVGHREPVRVPVQGATDIFSPAYGALANFPSTGSDLVKVTIDAELDFQPILPVDVPMWAFITVTNNETQVISTITPQP